MKKMRNTFLLLLVVVLMLSGCNINNSRVEKQFDDGSKFIRINNYSCFHKLYDAIGVYTEDAVNQIAIFSEEDFPETFDNEWIVKTENIISPKGYYVKYAYSDDGYIAYYDYDKSNYTGEYCIFSVSGMEERRFNSITELYKYIDLQNTELGKWYYSLDFDFCYEKELVRINNWSVVSVGNIATVRKGYEDMFSGKIDKYITENGYLAFHIEINGSMESDLRAFGNPILKCEEENVVDYTFLFKIPVYYDHYVVVNTIDDSYEIFDSKKETEIYLNDKNISIDWNKTN